MAITAKCNHKCPGNKECTCNGLVKHQHHICRDVTCRCHSAEAYGLATGGGAGGGVCAAAPAHGGG